MFSKYSQLLQHSLLFLNYPYSKSPSDSCISLPWGGVYNTQVCVWTGKLWRCVGVITVLTTQYRRVHIKANLFDTFFDIYWLLHVRFTECSGRISSTNELTSDVAISNTDLLDLLRSSEVACEHEEIIFWWVYTFGFMSNTIIYLLLYHNTTFRSCSTMSKWKQSW